MHDIRSTSRTSIGNALLTIAMACLFLVLLFLSDSSKTVYTSYPSAEAFNLLFTAALVSALVSMGTLAIAGMANLRLPRHLCDIGGVLAVSSLLISAFKATEPLPSVLSGALLGCGFALMAMKAIMLLQQLSPHTAMFMTSISMACASLVKFMVIAFALPPITSLWLVIFAAAISLLALRQTGTNNPIFDQETVIASTKRFFKTTWIALACAALCTYTVACIWGASANNLTIGSDLWPGLSLRSTLGSLFAALLILILIFLDGRRKKHLSSLVEPLKDFGPLICISLLLISFLFRADVSGMSSSANVIFGFCMATCALVLLSKFSSDSLPSSAVISGTALSAAFILFAALASMYIWPLMGDSFAQSVSVTLRIIFLTVVVIVLFRTKASSSSTEDDARKNELKAIGARYGLSEREMEVLPFLLERRSATYISEKLFISSNTVKTHTRHIYEKTGIHTREELIALFPNS